MEKDIMTTLEFKTVMEMVVLIIENSKNKEEALEKTPSGLRNFLLPLGT